MGNWGSFTLLSSGYFTPFITGSGPPPPLVGKKQRPPPQKKRVLQTRLHQKRWATKKNEKGRAVSTWEISMQKNISFMKFLQRKLVSGIYEAAVLVFSPKNII